MARDFHLVDGVRTEAVRRDLFVAEPHHQHLEEIVKGNQIFELCRDRTRRAFPDILLFRKQPLYFDGHIGAARLAERFFSRLVGDLDRDDRNILIELHLFFDVTGRCLRWLHCAAFLLRRLPRFLQKRVQFDRQIRPVIHFFAPCLSVF